MSNDSRKVQLEVSADTTPVEQGFKRVEDRAEQMAGKLSGAGEKAGTGLDKGIGSGVDGSAKKVDKATNSIIASIQRATAVAEAGGKGTAAYYEVLARQRGADVEAIKPFLAEYERVAKANERVGVSAAQMQAALRGVPAQFTDIATSLAGGQNPLTVFLQQGGQLKDMFGGAGAAAQALGGYVAGLVTPMTSAVAVLGLMAVAAHQGAEESRRMQQALIMSGDAAGMSFSQVTDAAKSAADQTGSTQSKMAGLIAEMAASGKVAGSAMQQAAEAAHYLEKAGVQASQKTVEQFIELGKSPSEAAAKLNEQYHFLTAAVWEQIKALEEQGRTLDAAALAQRTFADEMAGRGRELVDNLGTLERAWNAVTGAAKGAWNAMLSAGRQKSVSDLIAEVKADLQRGTTDDYGGEGAARASLANLEARLAAENAAAKAKGESAKAEAAGIEWAKAGDQFLSKRQKMEVEIAKAREMGLAAGKSEVEIQSRLADIREKYKEKDPAKKAETPLERMQRDARASAAGVSPETLKSIEELNKAYAAGKVSRDEYFNLAAVELEKDSVIAKNKKAVADSIKEQLQAEQLLADYRGQNQRVIDRIAREAELATMSDRQRAIVEAQYKAEDDAQKLRERIIHQVKDETAQKAALIEVEAELAQQKSRVADAAAKSFDQSRTWEVGWSRAFNRYADDASNAARTAETAFRSATDGMADALTKWATGGKLSVTDFATTFVQQMVRMQMQAAAAQATKSAGGWLSGAFSMLGGLFGGGSFASSGYSNLGSGLSLGSYSAGGGLSFEGGGYTGDGARSGGVDGKGGFMAIVHPNETVIDHTKTQLPVLSSGSSSASAGLSSIRVEMINSGTQQEVTDVRPTFDLKGAVIQIFTDDVSRDGPMSRGFAGRFGLSRAGGAY